MAEMWSDRFKRAPKKDPDTGGISRLGHIGGRQEQLKRQECQAHGGKWVNGKCKRGA